MHDYLVLHRDTFKVGIALVTAASLSQQRCRQNLTRLVCQLEQLSAGPCEEWILVIERLSDALKITTSSKQLEYTFLKLNLWPYSDVPQLDKIPGYGILWTTG